MYGAAFWKRLFFCTSGALTGTQTHDIQNCSWCFRKNFIRKLCAFGMIIIRMRWGIRTAITGGWERHKDKSTSISDSYTEHLQEFFDGKLFTASDMVQAVNAWVREKTNGILPWWLWRASVCTPCLCDSWTCNGGSWLHRCEGRRHFGGQIPRRNEVWD